MLRIHSLRLRFILPDPGVEEAFYVSLSMRGFAGKDLVNEPVPDETTFCKFRHLLERKRLDKAIFSAVNQHPQASGLMVSSGTNVDTTLIAAPSSTKNQERDPEVKQAKKGNHRHIGIKTHIGTDSRTVLGHSVMVTPATPWQPARGVA